MTRTQQFFRRLFEQGEHIPDLKPGDRATMLTAIRVAVVRGIGLKFDIDSIMGD